MGRPRKNQIVDRAKGVEDYQKENEPKVEPQAPVQASGATEAKFKGVGTVLINGDVIGFRHGEYATDNVKQIAALEKSGFERLA